jgi:hypothetical protein
MTTTPTPTPPLENPIIRSYSWKEYDVPSPRNHSRKITIAVIYENELEIAMLQNEQDPSLFVMVPIQLRQRQLVGRPYEFEKEIGKSPEQLVREFKDLKYLELDGGFAVLDQVGRLYKEQHPGVELMQNIEEETSGALDHHQQTGFLTKTEILFRVPEVVDEEEQAEEEPEPEIEEPEPEGEGEVVVEE